MSISIRYPLVELMTGLFALCVYLKFGLTIQGLVYYIFICVLIVITFIDIDHRIIPDILSLPGIPLGFIAGILTSILTWKDSLLGILAGGGILFLIAWTYERITDREGMGGGDIKLLAMIGALIGWKGVLFTIFVSSAVGTLVGMIVMIKERGGMKLAVPFGPFLTIGCIAYVFWGQEIIQWYFGFFG